MQDKINYIVFLLALFLMVSCKKDLTGNAISIEASSNVSVDYFRLYYSCDPGPGMIPYGSFDNLNSEGNGNYSYQLDAGYTSSCFMITGTISANNDTTGKTVVNIDAFYTEEGNVVGFEDIELKRPHDQYAIRYEFRADTYIE